MVRALRSIPARSPETVAQLIAAGDGYPLAVRRYEPALPARATVLIHGATATPQSYYRRFAEHLATAGYRVISYDYRGIGDSRPASLRGFAARMSDWGRLDAAAVIAQVKRSHPGPLVSIGHSFGGQLLGITDAAHDVDAAVLVGAQLGSLRHWPLAARPGLALMWYGLVPALTAIKGYLPGGAGLGGVDLPAGVAREWARWCRSPSYLVDHVPHAAARFARFRAPTLAYSFTDDDFAPAGAVAALLERLDGARLRHRNLAPAELGVDRIGHFGFFRESMRDRLWTELVDHLDRIALGEPPALGEPIAPAASRTAAAPLFSITAEELRADLDHGRD
jgi:predicted alpha/beta hydrolase